MLKKVRVFGMVFGGLEKEHNRTADWLEGLKGERDYGQQGALEISEAMVKKQCKKIPNWKAPGWGGVQGFWIKRLDTMHGRIASQLSEILNGSARLPEWITYGRTVLCQKDLANLLFMDDLKLFGKSEDQIDSLVQTVQVFSEDIGMEFGLKKCGVLLMKRGKKVRFDGITILDGRIMREIEEEGYKYLGILEVDMMRKKEMKKRFVKEYKRRLKLVLKSKLNGKNKINAINSWAVSVLRYGANIIGWTKEELKALDRTTRKVLTMNGAFHPKSDVDRLYVSRVNGGRELISCDRCVRSEENSLRWYVKNLVEVLLQGVRATGVIRSEGTVSKDEFKTSWNNEKLNSWKDKRLHGQFVREIPETTHVEESWSWLRKTDLKIQTEALICASQEQALRTNYVKYHIDKTVESPLCRLCGEKGESVNHIVCECKKLAQREYKQRHDNVARAVHWKLCEKYHLDKTDKW